MGRSHLAAGGRHRRVTHLIRALSVGLLPFILAEAWVVSGSALAICSSLARADAPITRAMSTPPGVLPCLPWRAGLCACSDASECVSVHLANHAPIHVSAHRVSGSAKRPLEVDKPAERRAVRLKWVCHEGLPAGGTGGDSEQADAADTGLELESYELVTAPVKSMQALPTPEQSLAAARLLASLINGACGAQQQEGAGLVFTTTVPLWRPQRRAPIGPPTRDALVSIPVPQPDERRG